jgi:serine/threonine protein kinase
MRGAMDPTQPVTDPRNWQPPAPETLQAMLPGYEVQAFLARGGMGAVYRGEQISLARPVAIKILPPELSDSDPHYSARFKQEARAMAQLNHPAIVSVYDFGEMPDGTFYFIMEFIDGTDVGQMVTKQGRLSSAHAMSITAHVCDALQYAHERGIVHRDIKPANIMVGYNGQVKVADFGLAKSVKQKDLGLTQDGYVMGTPHYVSPEALIMGLQVDHRADIYAMGVMLYEMLTGKLPQGLFEMPSLQVPGLDPRYDSIISSAMRDDRDRRYQSVLEMRRALDGILTQPVLRSEVAKQTVPGSVVSKNKPTAKASSPKAQANQGQNPPPQATAPAPRSKRFKKPVIGWVVNAAAIILVLGGLKWLSREKPIDPKVAITTASKEAPFINSLGMKFVPLPGTSVLMCMHETRRQDYEAYAKIVPLADQSWRDQKFNGWPCGHLDDHPVVGVSWNEAKAFCEWLSKKEGLHVRLPTDREWSQAAGIVTKEAWGANETPESRSSVVRGYSWGSHFPPKPEDSAGNFGDLTYKEKQSGEFYVKDYTDGFSSTAPVMSFKPNAFGFHDIEGNAREWITDWWNTTQTQRVLRGSAWHSCNDGWMHTSSRHHQKEDHRDVDTGFRCVIEAPAQFADEKLTDPVALAATSQGLVNKSITPSPTPINDPAFERELGAVSWKVSNKDWVAYFQPNHEVVVREGSEYRTWHWWVIAPKKIHVQFATESPVWDAKLGEDWEVNSEMTQITRISNGKLIAERDRSRPANSLGDESGFVTLLGSLSSGWRYSGPANANFGQSNGIYSFAARPSKNQPGMFWYTRKTFADFILRLEFRTSAFKKNSGIYLRMPALGEGITPLHLPGSYEIEIADQKTGIVPFTREGNLQPPPLIVGDWNTWEITAKGQAYEARLNGVLVTRFTGNGKTSGYIGIQDFDDGMAIEFRNVRIKELTPSTNLVNAPNAGTPTLQKLAELEDKARKAWDQNSAQLVAAEVAALGKSYLANGFPKALADAQRSNDQTGKAALEKERDAYISSSVVPSADETGVQPAVKALRATYHSAKQRIETSKRPMPITLYEPYFAELRKLIPTASGDDRKAVMKRYEELFDEAGFHTVSTAQMSPEFKQRCSGLERQTWLKAGGGSPECERAITHAFEFLKSKQNPNGSWGSQLPCLTTSLVLMAYLGRCEDAESPFYGDAVMKALMFLIESSRKNPDGVIASPNSTDPEVEHGAVTWALGEVYLMARFGSRTLPGLRDAFEKGIQLILKQQLPRGGWGKLGRNFSSQDVGDAYVTFWQLMALKQARRSGIRFEGLSESLNHVEQYWGSIRTKDANFGTQRGDGRRDPWLLTSMVLHAREALPVQQPHWNPLGKKFMAEFIRFEPPKWDKGDLMSWLFTSESLRNEAEFWPLWNRGFLPEVLSHQRPDGRWSARPTLFGTGSEEETAALCILMLETYYRSVKPEEKRKMR